MPADQPWKHEPDYVMFVSEAGYPCEIKRNSMGVLCGYIYIPAGHPDHGKSYQELESSVYTTRADGMVEESRPAPDVHGGWTYSDSGDAHTKFGFDCGHAGDYSPGLSHPTLLARVHHMDDIYRDMNYVREQLEQAAWQFKKRETQATGGSYATENKAAS